jgi:hypothetical protein
VVAGLGLLAAGSTRPAILLLGLYAITVAASAFLAGARFRSWPVAFLVFPALVATHAAYVAGFLRGFVRR